MLSTMIPQSSLAYVAARLLGCTTLALACAVPAFAQDPLTQEEAAEAIERTNPMAQARAAVARGDPAEALARFLRVLTRQPNDLEALTGAGRAALDIGDPTAALAFYARAEEIAPRNGRVKAGLGSAMVQMENARAALRFFDDAVDYGVPAGDVAADRGLAYDLRGDTKRAQAEYVLALRLRSDPETIRRLALSQAMAGDRATALQTLDPLLRRQDIPAWRARAFIFALTGDALEAEKAAAAVMPRAQAQALSPYLVRIATLKDSQKAAAVHFGHFPSDSRSRVQVASAEPAGETRAPVAGASLVPSGTPLGRGDGSEIEPLPSARRAEPRLPLPPRAPVGAAARIGETIPRPAEAKANPVASVTVSPIRFAPAEPAARAVEPSRAKAEAPKVESKRDKAGIAEAGVKAEAKGKTIPNALRTAEKDEAVKEPAKTTSKDAKAKTKEEAKADGKGKAAGKEPERYWVQVAGGANRESLPQTWSALKAKWPKQLGGRTPSTMAYRATNRLLVGPFKSSAEAQAFVNSGSKDGLASFAVTSEAGQAIEKLSVK
jgi:Flp pilus assembly protein TadD